MLDRSRDRGYTDTDHPLPGIKMDLWRANNLNQKKKKQNYKNPSDSSKPQDQREGFFSPGKRDAGFDQELTREVEVRTFLKLVETNTEIERKQQGLTGKKQNRQS